ncbi:MAG TPA: RsmE family RNA methyltransferase [Tepidisphaeraceae bacterium]|jgi:16S rRNA (uracil1498-N3)-methyltransferase|nr:RsmE family RNA methyltransferase [Tepidisphaeraceae bacterium]
MPRRFHVANLSVGANALDSTQSRHARDVLRLSAGTPVELFDDAGRSGAGDITATDPVVIVHVAAVDEPDSNALQLIVASAVPKANRADWLVEKLSELGVDTFIPLAAARSVVLPEGRGKSDRWQRISAEAAKQSHRSGVMTIEPLTSVAEVLKRLTGPAWCLSTEPGTVPVATALQTLPRLPGTTLTLFIGPEGGWTDGELAAFAAAGVQPIRLTASILRIETAAIAAAAVVMTAGG